MKCSVCKGEKETMICANCGFDESMNYEKYPTLTVHKKQVDSISKRVNNYHFPWEAAGIGDLYKFELLSVNAWHGVGKAQKDIAEFYFDCSELERYRFWKDQAEKSGYTVERSELGKNWNNQKTADIFNSIKNNDKKEIVITDICAGGFNTVVSLSDGTCVSTKILNLLFSWGQDKVSEWKDIIDISIGRCHTVGLKKDGTVISTSVTKATDFKYVTDYGQTRVAGWTDIVSIAAGKFWTVGLKRNGTIVFCGECPGGFRNTSQWSNLIAVASSDIHIMGLKKDGTVVAGGYNTYGQCNVSTWTDIVAISAGFVNSVGLRRNGTVVSTREKDTSFYGPHDFESWHNIKAISSGGFHTVGLRNDGTVVACGGNRYGQCNVSGWTDVVYISAGLTHTAAIRANGEILVAGENSCGQCNVKDLIKK